MAKTKHLDVIDTIANECIAVRVRLLNRVISGLYDEALRSYGLKVSQFNVLVLTAKMGLVQPRVIGEILQMDPSTVSRNVERMMKQGWLVVVPGEDGRSQPLQITQAGKALVEDAFSAWKAAQDQAKKLVGQDGTALLQKLGQRYLTPS